MTGLNCGSGQRKFDSSLGWINIDINPKWQPDVIADMRYLSMFADASVDFVVSSHTIEHLGCGESDGMVQEACRVLKVGGSLIISIPNIRALAERWLTGQIDDYIYIVNLMGAYMDDEADRHRWHFTRQSLKTMIEKNGSWSTIKNFNWRSIQGMDLARDWWIMATEAVKGESI